MVPRFLTLADVAEELATSSAQVYALVRSGELPAVKVGGRGQWRVERSKLEEWVTARYADTAAFVRAHPFPLSLVPAPDPPPDTADRDAGAAAGSDAGPGQTRTGQSSASGSMSAPGGT